MNEYNADIHRIMKLSRALTKSCKDWIVAILISINLLGFDPANVLSLLGYLQINRQSKAIRCNFAHWRFTVYVLSCRQPYNQLLLHYQQNESIFLSRVGDPMSRVENWGQYFFWVFFPSDVTNRRRCELNACQPRFSWPFSTFTCTFALS